jgi:hypothetical protein
VQPSLSLCLSLSTSRPRCRRSQLPWRRPRRLPLCIDLHVVHTSLPAGHERRGAVLAGRRCASTWRESRGASAGGGLQIGGSRAYRVNLNPNPNFWVPEMSGIDF